MRTLIIAPHHPSLPDVAAEAAAVANAHPGSVLLQGRVMQQDITAAAGKGGFDLVWLATHGAEDTIVLSDGSLSASQLITYIAASGAHTVLLNTCDSIHLAAQVVDHTSASVIATIQDVPDSEAARTGALFASQLAALGDVRQAYERSKPGHNRTYVYLANREPSRRDASAKPPAKPKTPRKKGAQPNNTNALTHGRYSKLLLEPEAEDIAAIMAEGIDNEIALMRVHIRRLVELKDGAQDLPTALTRLDNLGNASIRVAHLLRTKRLITPAQGNDVAKAIGEALSAVVKEMQL